MKVLNYFPFAVSTSCLVFAGAYKSVGMAAVAVASLLIIVLRDSINQWLEVKHNTSRQGIPEEVRRTIQDINARVATLEYGVKQRGF